MDAYAMSTEFPRILSLLRAEAGTSQRNAAQELGISQSLLSHYENGVREPGLAFVIKCAGYYHVSADYLLGLSMTRDSAHIDIDDLPDALAAKDSAAKGGVYASLNRRLLVNALSVVFDLLGKADSRPLIKESTGYVSITLYKLFRYLYAACGQNPDEFFSVPPSVFSQAADAEQKACEMRLCSIMAGEPVASYPEKSIPDFPKLSSEAILAEYPNFAQSLMSVLQSAGEQIARQIEKK